MACHRRILTASARATIACGAPPTGCRSPQHDNDFSPPAPPRALSAAGVGRGTKPSINVDLRKTLGLYANVVHSFNIPGVASRHSGVDIVIVRENTEGEFSGMEHEVVPGVTESLKVRARGGRSRFGRGLTRTWGFVCSARLLLPWASAACPNVPSWDPMHTCGRSTLGPKYPARPSDASLALATSLRTRPPRAHRYTH